MQSTMEQSHIVKMTISDFVHTLAKELNIEESKGLYGNELELIALVKNCQFLYDRNLPDFKNIAKKNEAWEAIGAIFGVSVTEVQQRWKGMRDLFGKYKNKNDGVGLIKRSVVCPYYDYLKFLEPHIIGRRPRLTNKSKEDGGRYLFSDTAESDEESFKDRDSSFGDIKSFIDKIKNSPILYHHKFSAPSYSQEKVNCWIKIAKSFGVPVKDCVSRWRTLRERYSRERRFKKDTGNGRKWEFYDDLSFLDEHVKSRNRSMRVVPTTVPSEHKVCFVVTSPNSSDTFDSSSILTSTKKEIPIEEVEFMDVAGEMTESSTPLSNEENILAEVTQSDHIASTEESSGKHSLDEDELFGQTIAAELRKLSCSRKKIKLKAEIYRLLYEHAE